MAPAIATLNIKDRDGLLIRSVALTASAVTVGWAGEDDEGVVVLPNRRLARRHLRLASDAAGLRVTNLDTLQRTWLIEKSEGKATLLLPDCSYAWPVSAQIEIHEAPAPPATSDPANKQTLLYCLSLGPGDAQSAVARAQTLLALPVAQPISIEQEGAQVPLQLMPGVPQSITVWLENHSAHDKQLALTILGTPASWLQALPKPVKVAARSRVSQVLQLRAPPDSHAQPGPYTVILRAQTVIEPGGNVHQVGAPETCETRVTWLVLPTTQVTTNQQSTARLTIVQAGDATALQLTPGVPQSVTIWLENHGEHVDELTLAVLGVPSSWVQAPVERVPIAPGSSVPIPLQLQVPPGPQSKAGAYSVTLRARSQLIDPTETCETRVTWLVLPNAEAPLLQITPAKQRASSEAVYTVTLQNRSNVETRFDLNVFDDEQALGFDMDEWRLMLPSGESAAFPLRVTSELPLVDSSHAYGFVVQSTPLGQPPTTKTAQFVHIAPPPRWRRPALALFGGALLVSLLILFISVLQRATFTQSQHDLKAIAQLQTSNAAAQASRVALDLVIRDTAYAQASRLMASAVVTATTSARQTATAFAPIGGTQTAVAYYENSTQQANAAAERAVVASALALATQQAIDAQVQQAAAALVAKTAVADEQAGKTAAVIANRTATAQMAVAGTAGALQTSTAVAAAAASAQAQQAATAQGAQAQQAATAQSITQTALAPASTVPDQLVFEGSTSPNNGQFTLKWKIVNRAGRVLDDANLNWIVQLVLETDKHKSQRDVTISSGTTTVQTSNGEAQFTGIVLSGTGRNRKYVFKAVLVGTKVRGYTPEFTWP
ncbi:MAG TPA: hypothetical protein PKK15_02585 [Kouleothrix sp.]|nr:hypothetical protein [Kouleothrix sp.]